MIPKKKKGVNESIVLVERVCMGAHESSLLLIIRMGASFSFSDPPVAAPPKPPGVERDDGPQTLEKDCLADALTLFLSFLLSLFDLIERENKIKR
jgi:hypothetical protein